MVKVKKLGILLKPTDLAFESRAVLNPGCVRRGRYVHMLYRAVGREGDSTIGYAKLDGPTKIVERLEKPVIKPEFDYERRSVEDPRLIFFKGQYYIFYVAYNGLDAVAAYATSQDLKHFKKGGVVTPRMTYDEVEDYFSESSVKEKYYMFESFFKDKVAKDVLLWEKDALMFPAKFKGRFALVHRILPDIQLIYFKNFKQLADKKYWQEYLKNLDDYVLLENKNWYESRHIGGGCPPILTKAGWLLIYHGVEESNKGLTYHAGAALVNKSNPLKLIGRLDQPLFSPDLPWELEGEVNRVTFPTGAALFGQDLYIYYGGADKMIGVATVKLDGLLKELLKHKVQVKKII